MCDSVWPDVGIKSSPKSPKVAKKLTTAVLFFKLILFKIFQNRTKYFELLFQEILLPRTFKNSPIWCLHTFPNRNICFLFSLYLLIQNWSHLNGPIPASFSFFYFRPFQMIQLNIFWCKRICCAWDSSPGRQDGRCRRFHWAMAAHFCQRWFYKRRSPRHGAQEGVVQRPFARRKAVG